MTKNGLAKNVCHCLELVVWQNCNFQYKLYDAALNYSYFPCRGNVLEALGSLPEPEEDAQTMVIRQSSQPTRKRRGSISQYIKRKLSKRKEGPFNAYNISAADSNLESPEAVSRKSPRRKLGHVS